MRVSDAYQYPLNTGLVRFDFTDLVDGEGVAAHLLPPGSVVIAGSVVVLQAWDSGTSAVLDVGDEDDDDRYTSTAIDLEEVGRTALTLTGHRYASPTELLLELTEVGTAATEGEAYLELTVIMEDRENESVS